MVTEFKYNLKLHRYPDISKQALQAWDAADEYLLEHVFSEKELLISSRILIFNDSFGALSLALQQYKPDVVTDSFISEQGILENSKKNNIQPPNILNSLSDFQHSYDYLLIKIPKTLDYLRYFITRIHPYINKDTMIIVAGMIKSTPRTVWKILEDMLGTTTTSLAKKKARLIFVKYEQNICQTNFPTFFKQEDTGYKIFNHANVFSKQTLDIGTRFLLQNIPRLENINTIIDLGCGNGIIGLNLAIAYPNAKVTFTDESYMSVSSAKLTAINNLETIKQHKFIVNNCLDGFVTGSTDLIVCNPPFHQSHSIGIHIALQMFQQSYQTLTKDGCLIVVANRHLPYYGHLKRIFKNIKTIAENKKFSIFLMRRTSN